jgi:hypothetical protein
LATDVCASAARKHTVAKDDAAIVAHPQRPRRKIERHDPPPLEMRVSSAMPVLPNRLRQNTIAQTSTGALRAKKPAVLNASAEAINSN